MSPTTPSIYQSPLNDTPPYAKAIVFSVFFSIPLLFALYTNHAWEDWYIAFRTSKNLALGNGLVFQVGERLHTFTSPLGVLIPALLAWITGGQADDLVLWLYRLLNCTLAGFSGLLAWQIGRSIHRYLFATLLGLFFLAIDPKIVDNTINGLETAIMIFFLALTIYTLVVATGRRQFWYLAVSLAGIMWTRPDGFVYVSGLLIGVLLWGNQLRPTMNRAAWFRLLLRAGLTAVVLYLPWIGWATWYYGTPIPNTVVAKGIGLSLSVGDLLLSIISFPVNVFVGAKGRLQLIFAPTYPQFGGWPLWLYTISKGLSVLAVFYWLLPRVPAWGRVFSLTAFISTMYLSTIKYPYPWYIPMGSFFCIYALSVLVDQALTFVRTRPLLVNGIRWGAGALALVQVGVLLAMAYEMRLQQQIIETDHRKQIGLWLKTNAKPNQTVFLECLGYVGFYSGLKTLDYPGLSSKEVIAVRHQLPPTTDGYPNEFGPLIERLRPDWLVLRDFEIDRITEQSSILKQAYCPIKVFDATPMVDQHKTMPGYGYLKWDSRFTVFCRSCCKNGNTAPITATTVGVPPQVTALK